MASPAPPDPVPFRPAAPPAFARLPEAEPLVSVLMRTRDRPSLLARALASVAAQTAPPREVIVVNDSGDAAAVEAVVAAAADAGPRTLPVRVLHLSPSRGRAGAAEAARAAASGPLLALFDDDDTWEPEFLAAAEARLRAPEDGTRLAGTVSHWRVVWERIAPDGTAIRLEESLARPAGSRRVALDEVMRGRNFAPCATVLCAEAVARAGGWDPDHVVGGDWALHMRVLALGDLAIIPRPLANWHRRREIAPGSSPLANATSEPAAYQAFEGELHTGLLRAALAEAPWLAGPLLLATRTAALAATRDMELRRELQAVRAALGDGLADRLAAIEARLAALEKAVAAASPAPCAPAAPGALARDPGADGG